MPPEPVACTLAEPEEEACAAPPPADAVLDAE
jgi:hypothetical protein